MRKRKALLRHKEGFIHGLPYLKDIFGYLNEVKLSVHSAAVKLMDTDENLKSIWTNCLGNLPVLQDVFLKIEFHSYSIS